MDTKVLEPIETQGGDLFNLGAVKAALLALGLVVVKLFKTNTVIGPTTTLADLTEADFAGYAELPITNLNGPFLGADGLIYMTTDLLLYQATGLSPGNTVFAAGICIQSGAAATGTAGQSGGAVDTPVVTAGGSGYAAPPKVTITDATIGTGATGHAVLTAGVVTSWVVDTPGTGYTGPIVTFEPPFDLHSGANFDAGLPMTAATDAIPLVLQIDQAA